MNILTIKAIHPSGLREMVVDGVHKVMLQTYTLILDDGGTEKATVVACRPEHNKAVGKALLKRLVPLKMDEKKGG